MTSAWRASEPHHEEARGLEVPSSLSFVHILLLLAAAFLVGLRVFRETQPKGADDEQTLQLQRFAKVASIGLVVLLIAVIVGYNLNTFHTAKAIQ
jgi:hypothetical protein